LQIGPLYHWSPRAVLRSIERQGLRPSQKSASALLLGDDDDFRQPAICFSPTAATAWSYSHDVWGTYGAFDLWEVQPGSDDSVHVLPHFGGHLAEVRIANPIPRARITWIGERFVPSPAEVLAGAQQPRDYSRRLRAEVRRLKKLDPKE
jgi:hypothetical protein